MISILTKLKGCKAGILKNGVAAGMLVLTMVGSASVNEAESGNKTAKSGKAHHWFQIGQASWYGGKFQGRKTANGEVFNMNNLTCAHRSLPMNSWVRVTNLKNHRFVFVRVNDRGPVPDNRVVDLSYAAARAVGLRGIGKVKLETVGNGDSEMAQELVAQLRMPLFLTAIR